MIQGNYYLISEKGGIIALNVITGRQRQSDLILKR